MLNEKSKDEKSVDSKIKITVTDLEQSHRTDLIEENFSSCVQAEIDKLEVEKKHELPIYNGPPGKLLVTRKRKGANVPLDPAAYPYDINLNNTFIRAVLNTTTRKRW